MFANKIKKYIDEKITEKKEYRVAVFTENYYDTDFLKINYTKNYTRTEEYSKYEEVLKDIEDKKIEIKVFPEWEVILLIDNSVIINNKILEYNRGRERAYFDIEAYYHFPEFCEYRVSKYMENDMYFDFDYFKKYCKLFGNSVLNNKKVLLIKNKKLKFFGEAEELETEIFMNQEEFPEKENNNYIFQDQDGILFVYNKYDRDIKFHHDYKLFEFFDNEEYSEVYVKYDEGHIFATNVSRRIKAIIELNLVLPETREIYRREFEEKDSLIETLKERLFNKKL